MDMFYDLPVKYVPSTPRNAVVKRQSQIMFSFNSKIFYFLLESNYASVLYFLLLKDLGLHSSSCELRYIHRIHNRS